MPNFSLTGSGVDIEYAFLDSNQFAKILNQGIDEDSIYDEYFSSTSTEAGRLFAACSLSVDGQSLVVNDFLGSPIQSKVPYRDWEFVLVRVDADEGESVLEVDGDFDSDLLSVYCEDVTLPDGKVVSLVRAEYDGDDFEHAWSNVKSRNYYLFSNSNGKVSFHEIP